LADVRGPPCKAGLRRFRGSGFGRLLRESPQAARRRQPVTRNRVAESANLRPGMVFRRGDRCSAFSFSFRRERSGKCCCWRA